MATKPNFASLINETCFLNKDIMECQTLERYDEQMNPVYKPKQAFNTQEEAISVAKIINSQDHVIHKVVPYRCKVCHKYHLGRNGKELKDKERQKHKKQINHVVFTHRTTLQKSDNSLI